jgi:quercetin dioxygenase-like cupin family protein
MNCTKAITIPGPSLHQIETVESSLLQMPQVETELTHRFAPGVYMREIFMPANSIILGHQHKTCHFNIVLSGRAKVLMNGEVQEFKAGDVIVSQPGVRKILYIQEDMRWATIHPTEETDIEKLEDQLIIKSESWLRHAGEYRRLTDSVPK